jgi:hypothetical protein
MLYGIYLASRLARQEIALSQNRSFLLHFKHPIFLAFLFMVFYALLHILTWAMARYRLPVDAVALPFAALALEHGVLFWRKRVRA